MPSRPTTPRSVPDFSISRNFPRVDLRTRSECEKKAKLQAKLLDSCLFVSFRLRSLLLFVKFYVKWRWIAAERKRNRVKRRLQETAYQQIRLSESFLLEIFLRRASSHERRLTRFPRANETMVGRRRAVSRTSTREISLSTAILSRRRKNWINRISR